MFISFTKKTRPKVIFVGFRTSGEWHGPLSHTDERLHVYPRCKRGIRKFHRLLREAWGGNLGKVKSHQIQWGRCEVSSEKGNYTEPIDAIGGNRESDTVFVEIYVQARCPVYAPGMVLLPGSIGIVCFRIIL